MKGQSTLRLSNRGGFSRPCNESLGQPRENVPAFRGPQVVEVLLSTTSSLKRVSVAPEVEPYLRLYRRLWLARLDLEEAAAILNELLAQRIPLPRSKPAGGLLLALNTALVVAYARPFVNSRGNSVADRVVPGSLLRVLNSAERELHETLIAQRNKEVAHSDADFLDLFLEVFPEGDGAILKATRQPMKRVALRTLQRILLKLDREIESRCEELRPILPSRVWL